MLNDFLKTIKGGLEQQLAGVSGLQTDKLDGVANVVTDTFKDNLVEKFTGGNIGDIVGLLGKAGSSSPFAGSMVNGVVANLMAKLGLSKDLSDSVAKIAVPFVIDKLGSFAAGKGKNSEAGIGELLGDLVKGSVKDQLLGGLGKKFGF